MCICASLLPMPRLPECSTTHTRRRSSTQSSKKWFPEPSVPNCFAASVRLVGRQLGGRRVRREPALGVARDPVVTRPTPAGIAVLDAAEQRLERVGQLVLGDVELGGDHAAADVDTDRRRDDRARRRDHRADGRADADVCVGHEGDVTLDDRKPSRLLGLADGLLVDLARPGDELVVDVGGHVTPFLVSGSFGRVGCGRRDSNPHRRRGAPGSSPLDDDHVVAMDAREGLSPSSRGLQPRA